MNGVLLVVAVLALLVAGVARRQGLSAPLLLVVVGLAASQVPGLGAVTLDPNLVLFVVLPPLLYSAALESSYIVLRRNRRAIGLLAVVLPLLTTLVVGWVAWLTVPQLPFAAALVLGAVVAPPDAVSATAVGRRLGLPRRIMTLLGGESLLNDATALTAYRVALAAAVGTGATLVSGVVSFAVAAIGGVAVGLAVGVVVARVRRRLDDPVLESAIGLVVPFGAYLAAEQLHLPGTPSDAHGSGVLAVVAAGLYLGHHSTTSGYATRLQDTAVWKAADVVLESFVFLLIGLQLPAVLEGLQGRSAATLLGASVAVLAATVLIRLLWMFPATYLPRLLSAEIRAREPAPPLGGVFVVAWAGMRGVVSLAAAFAIPLTTLSGSAFPGRAEILFLTFVVVVGTLLLHGLTLPWVIGRLGVRADAQAQADAVAEAAAHQEAATVSITRLDDLLADGGASVVHDQAGDVLRGWAQRRSNAAWERLGRDDGELGESPAAAFRRLRREMLAAEREVLIAHRDADRIDDEVLRRMLRELDLEEAMLMR